MKNLIKSFIVASALFLLITGPIMAQNKQNKQKTATVDRDAITTEVNLIKEFEGGQMFKEDIMNIVVVNGTYKQMGRQYGGLAKEQILNTIASWKKIFVESGALTYESIAEVVGTPFYESAPKKLKDFYEGMSETAGISIPEAVVLDNWLMLVLTGRRAGCSSYVAWGKNTDDGTPYMARNLDFPKFARDMIAANGVILVLNPVGGEFSVAGIGTAGVASGFNDAINSEGLYYEFNNGIGSIQPVLYSNRFALPSYMGQTLNNYSTIEELKVVFNTMRSDYPCIIGVCTPTEGAHFEISPDAYRVEISSDASSLRANEFVYPDWGIPQLPGKTGWYTFTRVGAWNKFLSSTSTKLNEKSYMQYMNAPMWNDDGTLTGTGFSVFEPAKDPSAGGGGEGGDVTVYQIITHPADLTWWVRLPTYTGWLEIDFKKYFNQ